MLISFYFEYVTEKLKPLRGIEDFLAKQTWYLNWD